MIHGTATTARIACKKNTVRVERHPSLCECNDNKQEDGTEPSATVMRTVVLCSILPSSHGAASTLVISMSHLVCTHHLSYAAVPAAGAGMHGLCCHETVCCCGVKRFEHLLPCSRAFLYARHLARSVAHIGGVRAPSKIIGKTGVVGAPSTIAASSKLSLLSVVQSIGAIGARSGMSQTLITSMRPFLLEGGITPTSPP